MIDAQCPDCGHTKIDVFVQHLTDELPWCEMCAVLADEAPDFVVPRLRRVFLPTGVAAVVGDDIPGGVLIHNGLCNADGTPRRYYSKTEMLREAHKRNMTNYVEHQSGKGTDKSKHTTRWV